MATSFAHQVGGHTTAKTSLKAHDGKILKPYQSKQRGERERDFYERVFRSEKESPDFGALRTFLPMYYGSTVIPEAGDEKKEDSCTKYLVLEDLTWGRKWPCIMDIKMGTRSYEEGASAEKVAHEKSKFSLQETAGLRIQGIKVYSLEENNYVVLDKYFGRSITSMDGITRALGHFFPLQDKTKTVKLLEAYLRRLDQLKTWFDEQQTTEFIASSFLFLYDGEESRREDKSVSEAYAADIRLIDFAHVSHPVPPKLDEGLRTGIATLIRCFQTLLCESQASQ
uniref:Kinase n=1 Tax=Peronospora matthiolae TaxID=2874970 RepID=A0AAV1UT77_9STRA